MHIKCASGLYVFGIIRSNKIKSISKKLLTLRYSIPSEFGRKPRSLFTYTHWKATEFRTFLLYAGPVCLKNILQKTVYESFLYLHTAVSIFVSEVHLFPENIDCCNQMLKLFVKGFQDIYGQEYVSHNIHNLLHICLDV